MFGCGRRQGEEEIVRSRSKRLLVIRAPVRPMTGSTRLTGVHSAGKTTKRWIQQICIHLLVYYLLTEIGLSDIIIMHEIRSIAGFGNGACFQNIGTVGNGKGHLCILFHQ